MVAGSLGATLLPTGTTNVVDAANRLTSAGSASLAYDAAGNLISDGVNTFSWNARHQLIAVSGGVGATFTYDAFGRRVTRTVNGVARHYLYDGLNIVEELDSGAAVTATLLNGLGVDDILTRTTAAGSTSV